MSHQLDRVPTGRTAAQLDRTATGPWAKTTSRPQAEAATALLPVGFPRPAAAAGKGAEAAEGAAAQ